MKRVRSVALILLGGALLALPLAAEPRAVSTSSYALEPDGAVEVENVDGSIHVEAWDRAAVEATVVKTARAGEAGLEDVSIEVEPEGSSIRFRTVYRQRSEAPVKVDYYLRVPRRARLERLHNINGDISVRGVQGGVVARTLNGNIEQTGVAGPVRARTVNGNVGLQLTGRPRTGESIHLETLSGDVFLALPAQSNADLEMSTVAGELETDFAFQVGEVEGREAARARLGKGGPPVRLRTVRGDIRVGLEPPL